MLSLAALLCCGVASAQQSLTCNPLVQVSVDDQSDALLTADDILEGDPVAGTQYFLMIKQGQRVLESGPTPITVDGRDAANRAYTYVGRTLSYELFNGDPNDPASNRCWGDITFEEIGRAHV